MPKIHPHNFTFRAAEIQDIPTVRKMIQELADSNKQGKGPKLTTEELIRDSGVRENTPLCHIYVLDYQMNIRDVPYVIGFAVCYPGYSIWTGKTYFLEDFYVRPECRMQGAGARIFKEVVIRAKELGCKRVDFHVQAFNPASAFYEKMGAINMTKTEQYNFYRIDKEQMDKLIGE